MILGGGVALYFFTAFNYETRFINKRDRATPTPATALDKFRTLQKTNLLLGETIDETPGAMEQAAIEFLDAFPDNETPQALLYSPERDLFESKRSIALALTGKLPDSIPRLENFASELEYGEAYLAWWEAYLENAKDPDEKQLALKIIDMGKQSLARELRRIKRAEEDRIRAIRVEEMDTWLAEMNARMEYLDSLSPAERWDYLRNLEPPENDITDSLFPPHQEDTITEQIPVQKAIDNPQADSVSDSPIDNQENPLLEDELRSIIQTYV
ncbi:hypothetical protein C6499_19360 [Candidatus Poribacteria bacterium]|nr:MAG: hypothetical protein C6499_19360 [Candidatus Poribacteria bacterium]